MPEKDRLLGLRAVVTGANEGIGDAIARLFAQNKAEVIAVDLPDTGVEQTFKSVNGVTGFGCDVGAPDAAESIFEEIDRRLGGLDILVNNAGVCITGRVEELTDEDWQRSLDVNVTPMFKLCRAALPLLKLSPAGRIINVGSIMSAFGGESLAAYAASKHAVLGLTRSVASEWGIHGITANAILPGAIMTSMTREAFRQDKDYRDYWINKSAARRLGEPLDVARVALFLASDDAVFVSGQALFVDGGAVQSV
ncbi:MAG: SDR family oxidoreductase [Pseudomonadota bacterium]